MLPAHMRIRMSASIQVSESFEEVTAEKNEVLENSDALRLIKR